MRKGRKIVDSKGNVYDTVNGLGKTIGVWDSTITRNIEKFGSFVHDGDRT